MTTTTHISIIGEILGREPDTPAYHTDRLADTAESLTTELAQHAQDHWTGDATEFRSAIDRLGHEIREILGAIRRNETAFDNLD